MAKPKRNSGLVKLPYFYGNIMSFFLIKFNLKLVINFINII